MRIKKNLMAVVAAAFLPLAAHATPVTWGITGMSFNDGGTGSGSFTYDADTNTYANINITTTAGSILGGDTYLFPNLLYAASQSPYYFLALDATGSDLTGFGFLTVQFDAFLTNAGIGTNIIGYREGTCTDSICSAADSIYRQPVAGRVTAITVPEPASLALMGLGLAGLGYSRRKAKKQ